MKKASSYKILVLTEDTSALQQYSALLLAEETYKFELKHLPSIELAHAEIDKYHPHCILMEADIQAETTLQFLQELRHSKSYRRYPVIWITAVNEGRTISKSIKLGIQTVLIKNELSTELIVSSIIQLVRNSRFIEQLKEQRKELLFKNKELSEYKKYLEMRVMSRTAELMDSYEQLVEEMTLRKQIEEQLTSRNKELDTFVYKASHDLKGPLASLIGVTNIARLDLTDPLSVKYLAMIGDSAQKLNFTLANLLEVTKIKYIDAEVKEVDFQSLLEQVTAPLQKRMEAAQISLKLSVQQPESFFSDPYLISTLLSNLIDNSINYKTENIIAFISIDISYKEKTMEITVTDNGEGIDKEVQSKVFDMFFRHNMQAKGSGLGLYIVKNCVEKLNGTLALLSEPGVGTEIKIRLPNLKQE